VSVADGGRPRRRRPAQARLTQPPADLSAMGRLCDRVPPKSDAGGT